MRCGPSTDRRDLILIRHIRGMRSCWSGEDDQLVGGVDVTVVVRWGPGLTLRCGTRMARAVIGGANQGDRRGRERTPSWLVRPCCATTGTKGGASQQGRRTRSTASETTAVQTGSIRHHLGGKVKPPLVTRCRAGEPRRGRGRRTWTTPKRMHASPGHLVVTPARTARLGYYYLAAAAGDTPRRAPRDPAGSHHLVPPSRRDGSRSYVVPPAAFSMACSSLASSADSSPIATRSSGLMKPSDSRKPPARAIASRSGTAQ
jgi:hypothetical protein